MIKLKNNEIEYKIDYEIFTTIEIVKIMEFYSALTQAHNRANYPRTLVAKYREYQSIINNKALEKKYDKMFESQTGFSIYRFMQEVIKRA